MRLRKFRHAFCDDVRFLAGKTNSLLVAALFVADELEEKWNVDSNAFRADALDPRMLVLIDRGRVERRVVEQNLDAVRARGYEAADGPDIEKIGQAAGTRVVIAAVFVGEQQTGVLRARKRGGQAVFGIEEDGAGVRRENLHDGGLEFLEHLRGYGILVAAFFLGNGTFQRTALVHGRGGDHVAGIRYRLEALLFSWREFHRVRPLCEASKERADILTRAERQVER